MNCVAFYNIEISAAIFKSLFVISGADSLQKKHFCLVRMTVITPQFGKSPAALFPEESELDLMNKSWVYLMTQRAGKCPCLQ